MDDEFITLMKKVNVNDTNSLDVFFVINLVNIFNMFDRENTFHYKALVEGIIYQDTYLREYGDIDNFVWNYKMLKNFLVIIINNFKSYLINLDFEDGYSDFNFVSLYIYNILSYALFNYKKKIDYQVMLNTLKGIQQIPLSLKIDIANFVLKELKLFYLKHPFSSKIKIHQKRRIIQFPKEDFN